MANGAGEEKLSNAGSRGASTRARGKWLAWSSVVPVLIGIVTLTGNVPSASEKRRAMELARETKGVKSVVDHLKVGPK